MDELLIAGAKAVALLSLAAYVLSMRPHKPKTPHPCEGCVHLYKVVERGCKRTWICHRDPYFSDEHDRSLKYCSQYEPRTEGKVEGGEDDET